MSNPRASAQGINPFTHGSALHTDLMKTQALKQALDRYGFDAAFGGARRDEEKSPRQGARVLDPFRPASLGPEAAAARTLARSTTPASAKGESLRVFPLSNWTELDIWQYIHREDIPIVPLYFAAERPVVERDGALIMVDDERMPLAPGETAAAAQGAIPHARLLSAHRRDRERRPTRLPAIIERDAARPRPPSARAGSSTTTAPHRWRRRSRRATSDERRSGPPRADIDAYLQAHDRKNLLRFITCGSVDDGKSTLIGRLLYESQADVRGSARGAGSDSRRVGTQGGELDFALLVDGLAAEREQGITIDVAYRFFATERRKFIVADTPGHEQYTRNMVTGASTADLAVILVDARKGVLTQTRRHSYLVSLLGIRQIVLAVNKMDLVGYVAAGVRAMSSATTGSSPAGSAWATITAIPVSALRGDNVIAAGRAACPGTAGQR